jgi:ComF family protein
MKNFVKKLEEFLLPPVCLLCGVEKVEMRKNFCSPCWQKAQFITKPYCEITGVPFSFEWEEGTVSRRAKLFPPLYDHARAALRYEGDFVRPLILRLKYGDRPELAAHVGDWLARAAKDILPDCDFITPVPLHWRRLLTRRFNQAAELSRALSFLSNRPYGADIMERTRRTAPHIGLSRKQRARNVRGAFAVKSKWKERVKDKHIILVDDVLTSGATVESCVRALRQSGVRRVDIVVLARVVHEEEMLV